VQIGRYTAWEQPITIGAGLACFELRPLGMTENYGIAIPCAQPTRYVVSRETLLAAKPGTSALLITGEAYDMRDRPRLSV
jgi:hypothetical protein